MSREAMKLALEAMERYQVKRQDFDRFADEITALQKALAEQPAQQEPVALFKWLPEGATHIGRISVRTAAGGSLAMTTYAFKYDSEVLKVYVTDNDNEYPGWRDAKDCFFHLNFPVLPLYTSPPAQQEPDWYHFVRHGDDCFVPYKGQAPANATALYTSPPAQRTWVGLTDKEKREARNAVSYSPLAMTMGEWTEAVQDATEAKLKEENNG